MGEVIDQLVLGPDSPQRILGIFGFADEEAEVGCQVCFESQKSVLLLPCRHCCICEGCLRSLPQERCPICRAVFTGFLLLPLPRETQELQESQEPQALPFCMQAS